MCIGSYVSNELIDGEGYVIYEHCIGTDLIDAFNSYRDRLYPVRASSLNKQYAEKGGITVLPDVAVWWSQMLFDWPEVQEIAKIVTPLVQQFNDKMVLYATDAVTINPRLSWINPHVDTPHRFEQWNEDERLLGVQCIVALEDMTSEYGTTGLIPGSQNQNWDIKKCYAGTYTRYFMDKYVQNDLPKGSVLIYNARVLHSSMPNYLPKPRPALLLNYLDGDIVEDVKKVDNIWSSNF
jgi:ectoine hydroxylase-related dioxygenase (phytanoyl-CoA dioxygenase family)